MERGGRFKATGHGYASRFVVGRPLLLCGLKQTRRSEIADWSSFIGSERPGLESWGVRLANYTVDRVQGSRRKRESHGRSGEQSIIGDFLNGPEHIADPVRDVPFRVSRIQMTKLLPPEGRLQSLGEEIANSLSSGIGLMAVIAAAIMSNA